MVMKTVAALLLAVWATANGRRVASVMVNVDTTHVSWAKLRAAAKAALCSG